MTACGICTAIDAGGTLRGVLCQEVHPTLGGSIGFILVAVLCDGRYNQIFEFLNF
jgi:hypothetical protein